MDNQQFLALVIKELTGEINAEEQAVLQEALAKDDALRRQYQSYKTYWEAPSGADGDTAAAFRKVQRQIQEAETATGLPPSFDARRKPRRLFFSWRSAAAILVLAAAGAWFLRQAYVKRQPTAPQYAWQEKYTPRKVRSKVTLPDGTQVMLNAESRLRYPAAFTGNSREVYLSGEAYFDVTRNASQPFIIHTGNMHIRVLGTAFNVRAYPDEPSSEAALIQGAIEVTLTERPADRIILKPKDKIVIRNTQHSLQQPPAQPAEQDSKARPIPEFALTGLTYFPERDSTIIETSWTSNKLVFRDEAFPALAKKMERWFGADIRFRSEEPQQYRFTGVFQEESLEQALYALQVTEHFRYEIRGQTVYIY